VFFNKIYVELERSKLVEVEWTPIVEKQQTQI